MRVIWNLRNDVAIPFNNIKEFEIRDCSKCSEKAKEEYGIQDWCVVVWFKVNVACEQFVFTANSKADCIHFVDEMEGFLP